MKKHIFGIALFSSIVASFALIYAFIYAPVIPQIEPVKQFETKYEKPTYCRKNRQKVSFQVLSSNYFYDEGKIVTKVQLNRNENFPKPEKLNIILSFSQTNGFNGIGGKYQIIENPFIDSDEKVVEIITRISSDEKISRTVNLYAKVNVAESEFSEQNENLTQTKAVLFVHGNSSIIKK